jgi:hypothetical protein
MNFVILDIANKNDSKLAKKLGIVGFPRISTVASDGLTVLDRHAGSISEKQLRQLIDQAINSES